MKIEIAVDHTSQAKSHRETQFLKNLIVQPILVKAVAPLSRESRFVL
jgi:hypothetical protein